ncbi:MAG TPA: BrxA/BrxB family bacilliredoxin [Gemmatimonadaceae bacterium]|nr:BrxA/BrxB family bacilliredoxin [Gemmatimonadaceae bacterium]
MSLPIRTAPAMYPEQLVAPMRAELTGIGFKELRTPEAVDAELKNATGTTLVVVNSVCGCSARNARPAAAAAIRHAVKPDRLTTVFAGQDADATARARSYFTGYPPSSPQIGLLKDGKVVFMLERWQIEGRPATEIAQDLEHAFDEYCG